MGQTKLKQDIYLHRCVTGEIGALYHEAAVRMDISDSVQSILYVLYNSDGKCLQSEIYKQSGISRQTINSAIRKLEKDGIVYLEQGFGRNTIVCLTEKGRAFTAEKAEFLFEIENRIFDEWTEKEQQEYLRLTEKFRDSLKKQLEIALKPSSASNGGE